MSNTRRDDGSFNNCRITQMELQALRQTTGITDNFVVGADVPTSLFIKASAARDLLLPAVTADLDGRRLQIYNEGTGVITLKTSSDAALSPARTIPGGVCATVQAIFAGLTAGAAWKQVARSS